MRLLILTFLVLCSHIVSAQNPTIYASDYVIPEVSDFEILPQLTERDNVFDHIYFYMKEGYSGGFKEKKYYFQNIDLLKNLKDEEIYFNTNFTFKNFIPGFYKNDNLKNSYEVDAQAGKKAPPKPNLFHVQDVLLEEDGSFKCLVLKSLNNAKYPVLYFSPQKMAEESDVSIGKLSDMGLYQMNALQSIKRRHQGQKYTLAHFNGSEVRVPSYTDLPTTIINSSILGGERNERGQVASNALVLSSIGGNYNLAMAGLVLSLGMEYNYKRQVSKMEEFRIQQRKVLYNFDLNSYSQLSREDFGPTIYWTYVDAFLLEDSSTPVLLLQNDNGAKVLVLEELSNMLMTPEQASTIQEKYGEEKFNQLYDGLLWDKMPLDLVHFAIGYPNYLAEVSDKDGVLYETFAFGKEWFFFENGSFVGKEWKNYRVENDVFSDTVTETVGQP